MNKFSATCLLLVCFSAALVSTQAAELPFAKFCGEQETTCNETCSNKIKEFTCNAVTGITTAPCTCEDGATKPAVDPPSVPLPPSTEEMESGASAPAPAAEPTSETTTPATDAPAPAASAAARAAGSVVALGFVAAAMLF